MRSSILVLLAVGLSVPVQAEIFQWTDSKGTIHFTDDYYRVPPSLKGSGRLIIRRDLPSGGPAFRVGEEEAGLDAAKTQEPPLEQELGPAPAAVVSYDSHDIQVVVNSFGSLSSSKHCLATERCRPRARFDFNDRRYVHPSVFDNTHEPRVRVAPSGRHRSFFRGSRFSAPKIRSK
ncbi:MAG: DUF4124 domain-containing protein [Candidatus Binatia bacterium]